MPAVPKGAKVPSDHQKPAVQLEAEKSETADVVWREHTFTVVSDPDDYPVEAVMAFETGRNFTGLEIILGAMQWAEFMKTRPRKRDGVELFEAIGEALGLGE